MEGHLYHLILYITLIPFYCICTSCSGAYSADNVEFPLVAYFGNMIDVVTWGVTVILNLPWHCAEVVHPMPTYANSKQHSCILRGDEKNSIREELKGNKLKWTSQENSFLSVLGLMEWDPDGSDISH